MNQSESEKKVIMLLRQIRNDRKALAEEGATPSLLGEYDQAAAYAEKVWNHLKNKDVKGAQALWTGAQTLHSIAGKHANKYRGLKRDIGRLLGGGNN